MKTAIVAIKYEEPDWQQTKQCIDKCHPTTLIYVDRKGIGSMAAAYNSGFSRVLELEPETKYVWFVSNVVFEDGLFERLIIEMERTGMAAIHPAFDSDHKFCRPISGKKNTILCPFVEFTSPMVRAEVFDQFQLDEQMPYWGHDIDWGYRVNQAGYSVGIFHGATVGHTYIRNSLPHRVTIERKKLRTSTDFQTVQALKKKYGANWRTVTKLTGRRGL